MVSVEVAERAVLLRWKKRSDSFVLVRLKAEAVLLAAEGVSFEIIGRVMDRAVRTVEGWLRDWNRWRLGSIVTGHAGNENASKLTRDQKREVTQILASLPSENGVPVAFWDVPALRDVVSSRFDVEYESLSSYRLLMRFAGMSFKHPDPFDKRRDESVIAARMGEVSTRVADLIADGYEVYAVDEVRVEHEAETRRMWLPRGQRTKLLVDRNRAACSFFGAMSLTGKQVKVYPIEGNQNTEQIILALARLQRETSAEKIAVVWDNARFHRSKDLVKLFEPGEALSSITPVYLPPYAPEQNPIEHVWNTAKGAIANVQRDTPEETFTAFIDYINNRTFDYDTDHLTTPDTETGLV